MEKSAPVRPRERVAAIDILRGFALFGVLAINLDTEFRVTLFEQFFAAPNGGLDFAAAALLSLAFEFKAITLFSILFGAGLAIQFDRLASYNRTTLVVRRLLVLLAFGLVHMLLIWNGDILTEYAIAALLILPFLHAPQRVVLAGAAASFALYLAMSRLPLPFSFPNAAWMTQHIAQAREAYGHGSFYDAMVFRITEVPQIAKLHAYIFPRTMALMLFGLWIWRTGLLRNLQKYSRELPICGAVLVLAGGLLTLEAHGFSAFTNSLFSERLVEAVSPIALALGYAALILSASISQRLLPAIAWMAPIGRMAFTNYIAQSVVLTLLFYGFGFGLTGSVGVAGGLAIAVFIYGIQAWASNWWLRHYRFGPLEWLWRSLMYGERQQWRREAEAPSAVATVVPLP